MDVGKATHPTFCDLATDEMSRRRIELIENVQMIAVIRKPSEILEIFIERERPNRQQIHGIDGRIERDRRRMTRGSHDRTRHPTKQQCLRGLQQKPVQRIPFFRIHPQDQSPPRADELREVSDRRIRVGGVMNDSYAVNDVEALAVVPARDVALEDFDVLQSAGIAASDIRRVEIDADDSLGERRDELDMVAGSAAGIQHGFTREIFNLIWLDPIRKQPIDPVFHDRPLVFPFRLPRLDFFGHFSDESLALYVYSRRMEHPTGLTTMAPAMEEAQNYQDWVYAAVRPTLGNKVLELGPGYGSIAARAIADRKSYFAIDIDAEVIRRLRQRLGLGEDRLIIGDFGDWAGRLRVVGIDTVLMINVLEHVEDDLGLIKTAARCSPGGRLVVMVPAHPFLFGSLDREAGHFRRYSRAGLLSLLSRAGCSVERIHRLNAIGVGAWFVSARLLRLRINSEATGDSVRFYDRFVVPWARRIDPCLSWLCGQSLVALARLPNG